MSVWPSFAALAVLAFIGPVLAQNSPAVMMPGVNSRSSSIDVTVRRRRPARVMMTPSPSAQLPPIYLPPTSRQGRYDQPTIVPLPAENRAVEDRRKPSMVMMDGMDIEELEIGNLRMLNSISTMEEYAAMFGFEMPVAANDSGSGIAARFGKAGTEVELPHAMCNPEEKTVVLDIPVEPNVVYIPSCVRLKRCGGCCLGSMLKCQPSKTEAIVIKVMRVASSTTTTSTRSSGPERGRERPGSSSRDTSTRSRRQNAVEIITVPEEQHIECDCLCRVQERDCNPALQEYIPNNCRCQCRNSDEKLKCTARPMTHYWDHDQCICFCLKTFNCSATLRFDHTTCSCVQIPQNLLPGEGSSFNRRPGFLGDNALDEGNEMF